ncbi:hypothetical protein B0H14DRAFT_3858954 [Mycena olivaceomarginata]|nr:hypothetical protein B0H14DRAFT_3858954 [Mycena olivaceomarginata]
MGKRKRNRGRNHQESEDYIVGLHLGFVSYVVRNVTIGAEVITRARVNINLPAPWEYRVKWAGYDSDEDSWEPANNLTACEGLLFRFWNEIGFDDDEYGHGHVFIPSKEWIELERRLFRAESAQNKKHKWERRGEELQKKVGDQPAINVEPRTPKPLFLPFSDMSADESPIEDANTQSPPYFIPDDSAARLQTWQEALLSYIAMPPQQLNHSADIIERLRDGQSSRRYEGGLLDSGGLNERGAEEKEPETLAFTTAFPAAFTPSVQAPGASNYVFMLESAGLGDDDRGGIAQITAHGDVGVLLPPVGANTRHTALESESDACSSTGKFHGQGMKLEFLSQWAKCEKIADAPTNLPPSFPFANPHDLLPHDEPELGDDATVLQESEKHPSEDDAPTFAKASEGENLEAVLITQIRAMAPAEEKMQAGEQGRRVDADAAESHVSKLARTATVDAALKDESGASRVPTKSLAGVSKFEDAYRRARAPAGPPSCSVFALVRRAKEASEQLSLYPIGFSTSPMPILVVALTLPLFFFTLGQHVRPGHHRRQAQTLALGENCHYGSRCQPTCSQDRDDVIDVDGNDLTSAEFDLVDNDSD